jgi:CxxC motif-containing protein (DUF1111 family)
MFVLAVVAVSMTSSVPPALSQGGPTEAPTGFDDLTNGLVDQATHDGDWMLFERRLEILDGLGPVYNAQSCAECHQNPRSGGISQITNLRAGHDDDFGNFVDAPGGSLIQQRAIFPAIRERVPGFENVRTFRTSLNALGGGFVEAINSNTLVAIANAQPGQSGGRIAGQFIEVPVTEAMGGATSVGRFGWKNQHASLLSMAADEYLNQIGITNRLFPIENTSLGRSVAFFDIVPDPEDVNNDIDVFVRFLRATKAPPRDVALAATPDAVAGSVLFDQIGCDICHVRSITTAAVGTVINGGAFTVPAALGNKIIHPFSDFLLHDVGTGDGIVQNGGQGTKNKLRTPPLWGMRTRDPLMHDGESLTRDAAILRHGGEAASVREAYTLLSDTEKFQLITFLDSL